MTLLTSGTVQVLGCSTIRFQVSEPMVAAFASLTGDRSALHVSDSFARRSAYRRPVVHGMLPVGFISLLVPRRETLTGFLMSLTGRFTSPVHVGDSLELTAEPRAAVSEGAEVEFDYRITNDASRTAVTSGTFRVKYGDRPSDAGAERPGPSSMLSESAEPNDYRLEQVEIGTRDVLDFSISDSTLRGFVDLLALGGTDRLKADALLDGGLHLPNLLALLLFSTSVGVSLPGSSATFLEFSAECARPIALRRQYRLEGTVAHRSMATRIVKKALVVQESGADAPASLTGKVATLVNKPGSAMPTISELKEAATDRGLAGKVVLITGASRGIGETTAKLFALNGSRVVVNYHRGSEDAARVAREITDAGGEAVAIAADVADPGQVRALVDATMERYGAIHVLVNNAARDYRPIPFLKLTWDEVQKDLDVVARGAFLCCQQVIPIMLAQGGGKIVSISSVAVDDPPADQTKYVMAKSALVGLTRSLSIEFASRNIQANLVVPNFVETDLVAHIQDGFRRKIAQETPMRRHGSPVEVAQAVVFLASAHASFTTGQKIMVTGGGAPYL